MGELPTQLVSGMQPKDARKQALEAAFEELNRQAGGSKRGIHDFTHSRLCDRLLEKVAKHPAYTDLSLADTKRSVTHFLGSRLGWQTKGPGPNGKQQKSVAKKTEVLSGSVADRFREFLRINKPGLVERITMIEIIVAPLKEEIIAQEDFIKGERTWHTKRIETLSRLTSHRPINEKNMAIGGE